MAYHITGYKDGYSNTKAGLETAKPEIYCDNAKCFQAFPFRWPDYDRRIDIEGVKFMKNFINNIASDKLACVGF